MGSSSIRTKSVQWYSRSTLFGGRGVARLTTKRGGGMYWQQVYLNGEVSDHRRVISRKELLNLMLCENWIDITHLRMGAGL